LIEAVYSYINIFLIFILLGSSFIGFHLKINKLDIFGISFLNSYTVSFVIISFLLLLILIPINFFYSLDNTLSFLFCLSGIIFYLSEILKKNKKLIIKNTLIITFISSIFAFNAENNNDFSYHFIHMELYKNFNVVEFLSNSIDGRIKYNSSWLLLNSFSWIKNLDNSIYFLSSFLFSISLIDIREIVKNHKKNHQNFNYSKLFLALSFVFLIFCVTKYKDIGTDYGGHIIAIVFMCIYLFVYEVFNEKFSTYKFFLFITLTIILLATMKISLILLSLLIIHYFLEVYKIKKLTLNHFIIGAIPLILLILWFMQNYLISNCLIFPISALCSELTKEGAQFEYNMIGLFSKSVKINYWDSTIDELIVLGEFKNWIGYWISNHFYKVIEKLAPVYFIIIAIYSFLFFKYKNIDEIKNKKIENKSLFLIFSLIILIWFISSPALRFGLSYLIIYSNLLLIGLYQRLFGNNFIRDNFNNNYYNYLIAIFVTYNLIRIFSAF